MSEGEGSREIIGDAGDFYYDWTVVFKSGAILELKQVALVRHLDGSGNLEKICVTRSVPLGAEVAINGKGDRQLPLDEISGVFLAQPNTKDPEA